MRKFNFIVCGGTFDHFHKGHEEFLKFALSTGKKLLIGLTTEIYLKKYGYKKKEDAIEKYSVREKNLKKFFEKENVLNRIQIIPIDDVAGPMVYDSSINLEAIIVSAETLKGAEFINLERKKKKLPPLKIIVFPMLKDENNKYLSSSRIRMGEVNRKGRSYINPLWYSVNLNITSTLRKKLSKPFGDLKKMEDIDFSKFDPSKIITVGDVVTKLFNEKEINQKISIIDFKIQRKNTFASRKDLKFGGEEYVIKAKNPPGLITPSLWEAVSKIRSLIDENKRIVIEIEGEEDLSVIPLILVLPIGYVIFYGQPGKGIVKVSVNYKKKEQAYNLVNKFNKLTRGY